jgi:hypothetical protein
VALSQKEENRCTTGVLYVLCGVIWYYEGLQNIEKHCQWPCLKKKETGEDDKSAKHRMNYQTNTYTICINGF